MNLSTLLHPGNQNTVTSETVKGTVSVSDIQSHNTANLVKNLQPGQMIQGEVVAKTGNEITILVGKDQYVSARLDSGISINLGQSITFEVKSNSGSKIALSPLYENMGQDPNILKALDAASLPVTKETTDMVFTMMEQGLSVNKDSLLQMNRLVMTHPDTSIATIVQMARMQLPVTSDNIVQFEAYQRYEHQISQAVSDITGQLPDTFTQLAANGQMEQAVDLYQELLTLFTADGEKTTLPNTQTDVIQVGAAEYQRTTVITGNREMPESLEISQTLAMEGKAALPTASDTLLEAFRELPTDRVGLSASAAETFAQNLEQLGFPETLTNQVRAGTITSTELLQQINAFLQEHGGTISKEQIADLFGSREFGLLLGREIENQWLLKPEMVGEQDRVSDFYQRLNEQTTRITQALEQVMKQDMPIAKSVSSLSQNVEFINQLNQMVTYLQLPLKMNGKNTHGEIYVYTNKRNLAQKEGRVSALLHLDMENLGSVDVYVAMEQQKVSTKFYLSNDSVIDLIAANIHFLNERLEKRGYSMTSEIVERDPKKKTVVEELLDAEKGVSVMSSYSFDVRA